MVNSVMLKVFEFYMLFLLVLVVKVVCFVLFIFKEYYFSFLKVNLCFICLCKYEIISDIIKGCCLR